MSNWYKWEEELIKQLEGEDQDFAKVMQRHHFLEQSLDRLSTKGRLSAEEESEERKLKREKLLLRDKIETILRNHKNQKNVVLPV
jgi:uncharacterized protein YdcH (DUF465 family)